MIRSHLLGVWGNSDSADDDGCVGRREHLLEQFGQSGEFESGILSRMIRFLLLLRLDGVFRMMQARRDGMAAEPVRAEIARTACRVRSIREPVDFDAGDISLMIAADGAEHSRLTFMAAEQFSVSQNCFCLFESVLGSSLDQICLETLCHLSSPHINCMRIAG